jgi:hypothetical protein
MSNGEMTSTDDDDVVPLLLGGPTDAAAGRSSTSGASAPSPKPLAALEPPAAAQPLLSVAAAAAWHTSPPDISPLQVTLEKPAAVGVVRSKFGKAAASPWCEVYRSWRPVGQRCSKRKRSSAAKYLTVRIREITVPGGRGGAGGGDGGAGGEGGAGAGVRPGILALMCVL